MTADLMAGLMALPREIRYLLLSQEKTTAEGTVDTAERDDAGSMNRTARLTGLLYLVMSIIMVFGFMYAPRAFVVNGDAAATARRISEGEAMYRLTVLASAVGQIIFIFVVLNLYRLFRKVDRGLARLMVALVCVGVAAETVNTANRLAPLDFLSGYGFMSVFNRAQLEAMALSSIYLGNNLGQLITVFWGLWLIPFGLLTIKSGFFPKILGILLMIAGVGYIVSWLSFLVFPAQAGVIARFMMPLYFGEVPIVIWMLVMGANVTHGGQRAAELR
jgi:hypothetical protein